MIYKVYPLLNDFENLSRLKVNSSAHANTFDYHNIVVNKPWGYEYLWFQNEKVAIWFLFIAENQKTSFHCHVKKRTTLIVLDGKIKCSTIDDRYEMSTLDALILEPCTFHSSMSASSGGTIIMEIETPPLKGDLVRMNDDYGRQYEGYEKTNEYSSDFDEYEYQPFTEDTFNSWNFRTIEIEKTISISNLKDNTIMVVPILGNIVSNHKVIFEVGEGIAYSKNHLEMKIDNDNEYLVFRKKSLTL